MNKTPNFYSNLEDGPKLALRAFCCSTGYSFMTPRITMSRSTSIVAETLFFLNLLPGSLLFIFRVSSSYDRPQPLLHMTSSTSPTLLSERDGRFGYHERDSSLATPNALKNVLDDVATTSSSSPHYSGTFPRTIQPQPDHVLDPDSPSTKDHFPNAPNSPKASTHSTTTKTMPTNHLGLVLNYDYGYLPPVSSLDPETIFSNQETMLDLGPIQLKLISRGRF